MYDELTKVDIEKMQEELDQLRNRLPQIRIDVKTAADQGDRSENDEYKQARREMFQVKGRIRYLENMIKTAKVIDVTSKVGVTNLFDFIYISYPKEGVPEDQWRRRTIRVVTTLRNDIFNDCISKESPVGKAVLGHMAGETVTVVANGMTYPIKIEKIEKGEDDANLPINTR